MKYIYISTYIYIYNIYLYRHNRLGAPAKVANGHKATTIATIMRNSYAKPASE